MLSFQLQQSEHGTCSADGAIQHTLLRARPEQLLDMTQTVNSRDYQLIERYPISSPELKDHWPFSVQFPKN